MRSYNLDPEQARQAGAMSRIDESGKYIGRFTRAEAIVSRQQTEGVEFTFETNDGRTADFLSCWTHAADGRELYGLKVLNAILTCMRVRAIAPKPATLTNRDGSTRNGTVFPDLMGKPIGLLLQREEYLKNNGEVGYKFNIVIPFDAASELTASEILDKATTPESLAKRLAGLHDKLLGYNAGGGRRRSAEPASQPDGGIAGMDDDIPF